MFYKVKRNGKEVFVGSLVEGDSILGKFDNDEVLLILNKKLDREPPLEIENLSNYPLSIFFTFKDILSEFSEGGFNYLSDLSRITEEFIESSSFKGRTLKKLNLLKDALGGDCTRLRLSPIKLFFSAYWDYFFKRKDLKPPINIGELVEYGKKYSVEDSCFGSGARIKVEARYEALRWLLREK